MQNHKDAKHWRKIMFDNSVSYIGTMVGLSEPLCNGVNDAKFRHIFNGSMTP